MYLIQGRRKNGRPAYVGDSGEGHFFAADAMDAALVASARTAKGMLASVPRMSTYFDGGSMDMASFALHRAELRTVPVALDDAVRAKLADGEATAPCGWRYLVVDESAERFAAPARHWSPSTSSLSEAVALTGLGGAVELLDRMWDGWRLVVGHVDVQATPMSAQDLDADLAEEAAAADRLPDEDLSDQAVYVPRF